MSRGFATRAVGRRAVRVLAVLPGAEPGFDGPGADPGFDGLGQAMPQCLLKKERERERAMP